MRILSRPTHLIKAASLIVNKPSGKTTADNLEICMISEVSGISVIPDPNFSS